ncbi:hypothetical protein [Deinococcus fonticola]|uniref:hypothetical protein n=1 Tax=Deinococcus fonticola TaxID=2528713 RepID=UPI001075693E|nr:hypothetical protein [Deinococcus fonticola]
MITNRDLIKDAIQVKYPTLQISEDALYQLSIYEGMVVKAEQIGEIRGKPYLMACGYKFNSLEVSPLRDNSYSSLLSRATDGFQLPVFEIGVLYYFDPIPIDFKNNGGNILTGNRPISDRSELLTIYMGVDGSVWIINIDGESISRVAGSIKELLAMTPDVHYISQHSHTFPLY